MATLRFFTVYTRTYGNYEVLAFNRRHALAVVVARLAARGVFNERTAQDVTSWCIARRDRQSTSPTAGRAASAETAEPRDDASTGLANGGKA